MNRSGSNTYRNYWQNCGKLQLSPLQQCNLVQMECLPQPHQSETAYPPEESKGRAGGEGIIVSGLIGKTSAG